MVEEVMILLKQLQSKVGNAPVYIAIGDNAVPLGSVEAYSRGENVFIVLSPIEDIE